MAEAAAEAPAQGKDKKKVVVIAVAVLVAAAAAYYFLVLKGNGAAHAEEGPPKEPGAVVRVEPITLNLADGHYLKMGMAVQFALADGGGHGGGEPDAAHATDIAISHFSNRSVAELSSGEAREKAKKEFVHKVAEAYHGEVLDIWFTEFVMQ